MIGEKNLRLIKVCFFISFTDRIKNVKKYIDDQCKFSVITPECRITKNNY
jgi:hypothetical protein